MIFFFKYANDSALLISHKDKEEVEDILSTELSDNKLALHLGKTEAILFASPTKLRRSSRWKQEIQ